MEKPTENVMSDNVTPFDDFFYLMNAVLLGEEPVSKCHFYVK
jgi:hypothetical protein